MTARAPEGQRLDHVAPAADAPVEQHLDLVADGLGDGRQHADGRRGPVEVVAAVVGDRDGGDPGVHGPPGVVDPDDALQHERAAPLLRAARPRRPSSAAASASTRRRRRRTWAPAGPAGPCSGRSGRGGARSGRRPAASGAGQDLGGEPQHRSCRSIRSGMAGLPQSRPLENDQSSVAMSPTAPAARARSSRSAICVACPRSSRSGRRSGGWPRRPLRSACWRSELRPMAVPRGRRGPGHRHLAVGVDGLDPGGGDDDRHGDRLAHDRGGQVALVAQAGHVGGEAELAEGGHVVLGGHALLGSGDQGLVHRSRQASWPGAAPRRPSRTRGCSWWVPVSAHAGASDLIGWFDPHRR